MTLIGSDIMLRGERWTVLGIVDNAAHVQRREGAPVRCAISVPSAWRAYAALTAVLTAEQAAERYDIRSERHLRVNRSAE